LAGSSPSNEGLFSFLRSQQEGRRKTGGKGGDTNSGDQEESGGRTGSQSESVEWDG